MFTHPRTFTILCLTNSSANTLTLLSEIWLTHNLEPNSFKVKGTTTGFYM